MLTIWKHSLSFALVLIVIFLIACGGHTNPESGESKDHHSTPEARESGSLDIETSDGCPTAQERSYFAAMREEAEAMGRYLNRMGILNRMLALDPLLVIDESWKEDIYLHLTLIKASADLMMAFDPPNSAQTIHNDIDQASKAYKQFAVLYGHAVDKVDVDLLEGASDYLDLGNESMGNAAREAEGFCRNERSEFIPMPVIPVNISPLPIETPIPARKMLPDPSPTIIPTPYPTPMIVATALPFPTPIPPTPTIVPTPTPNGPMMAQEECQQVVNEFMGSIIEAVIQERSDEPMPFRYWAEGRSQGQNLGYFLQYQEYSGFGERPTHHRVWGNVLVHWWNNEIELYALEFFPHPMTCLPRLDGIYEDPGYYQDWIVYEGVEFGIVGHIGDTENPAYYLDGLGEPTGIVEP